MREPRSTPTMLKDLLPAYYRDRSQLVQPLLGLADVLLAQTRERVGQRENRWSDGELIDLARRWFPFHGGGAVDAQVDDRPNPTAQGIRSWFRKRVGVASRLWSGLRAVPGSDHSLQLLRDVHPTVVVTVAMECSSENLSRLSVPAELVPAQMRLQVIVTSSEEQNRPPYHRRRLVGKLLWDSEQQS